MAARVTFDSSESLRTVYAKPFSAGVTESDVRGLFSKYGSIEKVRLRKSQGGDFKGSVYVIFQTVEAANKAIANPPCRLGAAEKLHVMSKKEHDEVQQTMLQQLHSSNGSPSTHRIHTDSGDRPTDATKSGTSQPSPAPPQRKERQRSNKRKSSSDHKIDDSSSRKRSSAAVAELESRVKQLEQAVVDAERKLRDAEQQLQDEKRNSSLQLRSAHSETQLLEQELQQQREQMLKFVKEKAEVNKEKGEIDVAKREARLEIERIRKEFSERVQSQEAEIRRLRDKLMMEKHRGVKLNRPAVVTSLEDDL